VTTQTSQREPTDVRAQTINFQRHPAEQLRRLEQGRPSVRFLAFVAVLLLGGALLLAASGQDGSRHLWVPAVRLLALALAVLGIVALMRLRARPGRMADERAIWAAGARGEELVAAQLARLPEGFVVLNNVPLPGRDDVDHVVVGPAGVAVVETKYLSGQIACLGPGHWVQTKRDGPRLIADPAAQAERAAAAVRQGLRAAGWGHVPVWPLLVFAHPRSVLLVEASPVPVVRAAGLVEALLAEPGPGCLSAGEVAGVARAVATRPGAGRTRRRQGGQALVEMALMLPALLILALGLFAVARVTGSLLGVTAVTREAARAGVRAPDAATAWEWADARGQQVAGEYGLALENLQLDIDTSNFEVADPGDGLLTPGEIRVAATYTVDLSDVPLIAWTQAQVPLQRTFAEVVDPYRSTP
jgi:hypothetical protein